MPITQPVSIYTLPTAVLDVGVHGPFISPQVGTAYGAYQLSISAGGSWPSTPGQVMIITIERSQDSGITWQFDAEAALGPTPWYAKDGVTPVTTSTWTISMGNDGKGNANVMNATDLFRFTLNVQRLCAPLFTMKGVQ